MCNGCRFDVDESEDLIDGLPPCEAGLFSCKHLEQTKNRHGLTGKPFDRVNAGGLREAISSFNVLFSLSSRDAQGMPTLDAMNYYSCSVPYSEKLFFKLMSAQMNDRRRATAQAIERARNHG